MHILSYCAIGADKIRINTDEGNLFLQAVDENILRVVYTMKEQVDPWSPLEIQWEKRPLEKSTSSHMSVGEYAGSVEVSTANLTLRIHKADGHFTWIRGEVLLEEGRKTLTKKPVMTFCTGDESPVIRRVKTVDGERNFVENLREMVDHIGYSATLELKLDPDEQIHGLGQGEEGIYNYNGQRQFLYQHNMRIPMPFFASNKGYGILADCGSLQTWNKNTWQFDAVEQLDYYFISGYTLDQIIAGYRRLTGHAAMLPKWAYGYVQSKEKYSTQQELVDTAGRYRKLGIGLDCIVQDWKTWEADNWGCKILDKTRYPDLKAATDQLHNLHVHSMVSVWPNMNEGCRDYQEMLDAGFLLHDLSTYNAFDEKARQMYWHQCERELFNGGFDSWWCDSTEPFSGPDWNGEERRSDEERFRIVGEEHKKYLGEERANLYAVAHARGIFENQRNGTSHKRVLNLTRSGYPGSQKYGAVLWSGDVSARWDVLKKQIAEALNMAMSGYPYWTFDIGGFFVVHENWQARGCECNNDPTGKWFWQGDYEQGLEDRGYRELYVRWLQMGAFLPMMRSHGTDAPREIWNFGKPGEMFYDAIAKAIALRYRLIPYIYSMAGKVAMHDYTMVRSLLFDFAEDPKACACSDEYMFGDSLLICPVTTPMYYGRGSEKLNGSMTRKVYLPARCDWYDLYSETFYKGGQSICANAPLDHIPVFVKAGSIIPMEQRLTYAQEVPQTPLEWHLYAAHPDTAQGDRTHSNIVGLHPVMDQTPGKAGPRYVHAYLYYEDAGDDYGYEQGLYNEIPVTWNEKSHHITIGKAKHAFEGGLAGRTLRFVYHHGPKNKDEEDDFDIRNFMDTKHTYYYKGEPLEIDL